MNRWAALVAGGVASLLSSPAAPGARVLSLDQCADQYVLALSPRADIVGLSKRAGNADSFLATQAAGLPKRRATTESVLGVRPTVVVRFWGGDERLVADLRRRGARIATIADAADFSGVRANIRGVAASLGQTARGEALIAAMQRELAISAGAGRGAGAMYLTSGGDTAGAGTLIDAMIRAAGFANEARGAGYQSVSLERLLLRPPSVLVLGFFDGPLDAVERWSLGRQQSVRRLARARAMASLPGAILGCPAWFAADGAVSLARAAASRAD